MELFDVALPEPVAIDASLEVFRRPGDDMLDRWNGERLIRTTAGLNGFIPFMCRAAGVGLSEHLEAAVNVAAHRPVASAAIRGMFSYTSANFQSLLAMDPVIAELNDRYPGVRPVLQHDLFTALVRGISAQQINLKWAATIRGRLAERYGDRHEIGREFVYSLNPERLASADPAEIRGMQFTVRKAESIVSLAQEFASGRLTLGMLIPLSDEEVIRRLVLLRGIGLWSAEWTLCRTMGRPRVVAGDLGVRKAVGKAYLSGRMPTEAEVRDVTAHWGDSASVAQALVLHAYALNPR